MTVMYYVHVYRTADGKPTDNAIRTSVIGCGTTERDARRDAQMQVRNLMRKGLSYQLNAAPDKVWKRVR